MEHNLLPFLLERIRSASAEGRLIDVRELAAACSRSFSEAVPEEAIIERLTEAAEPEQIGLLKDDRAVRCYCRKSMADSWAEALHGVAGGDSAAAVATAVRRESRIYPRPSLISQFLTPPWALEEESLEAAVHLLTTDSGEYGDIADVEASNGDRYIYSKNYLSEARASYLAEWLSVGHEESQ